MAEGQCVKKEWDSIARSVLETKSGIGRYATAAWARGARSTGLSFAVGCEGQPRGELLASAAQLLGCSISCMACPLQAICSPSSFAFTIEGAACKAGWRQQGASINSAAAPRQQPCTTSRKQHFVSDLCSP